MKDDESMKTNGINRISRRATSDRGPRHDHDRPLDHGPRSISAAEES